MVSWRNDCLARLVEMEHEALDAWAVTNLGTTGVDAFPRGLYSQDSFPYLLNIIGPSSPGDLTENKQWGEGIDVRTFDVTIRVVVDHFTAKYEGENEELLNEIMPILMLYLENSLLLITETGTYTDPPDWLSPEGIEIEDTTGVGVFEMGGVGAVQVGEEISLSVTVFQNLNET